MPAPSDSYIDGSRVVRPLDFEGRPISLVGEESLLSLAPSTRVKYLGSGGRFQNCVCVCVWGGGVFIISGRSLSLYKA